MRDAPASFSSVSALREAHRRLVERRRAERDTPELLDEVAAFIEKARVTGAVLDGDLDREASQGLLDYWTNVLDRAGRPPTAATLLDFDVNLAPELDEADCPYLGLDAFDPDRQRFFFGRKRLIERLLERLRERRLVTVVGPSGGGKSSLVMAGLLPRLKAGAIPGSGGWRYPPPLVPGTDPLAALARAVRPAEVGDGGWIERTVEALRENPAHLARLLAAAGPAPAVLVVDQFEEVFTLSDPDSRDAFVECLLDLVAKPEPRHVAVLTLRSDFESHLARQPTLQELYEQGHVRMTPLSASELREAIEGPAELVGLKFEEGVVDELVHDILGEPAALPLLQFTLLKLWENRERNRVTERAYRRLGGGRLALSRSADACYEELIPEEQVTARRILLRLVRPGEGLEVTSHRVRREALVTGEDPGRIERVLAKLVAARLVRLTRGDTAADDQVEVAHEALVRNWPRLVDWLEDERERLTMRRRLETKAAEWLRLGGGDGGLLDEIALIEAERWLESPEAADLGYDESLTALVAASREAIEAAKRRKEAAERERAAIRERELEATRRLAQEQDKHIRDQARSTARLRVLAAAIFVAGSMAVGFAVASWHLLQEAKEKAEMADEAREEAEEARGDAVTHLQVYEALDLASAAVDGLDVDPELSVLLARDSVLKIRDVGEMATPEERARAEERTRGALFRSLAAFSPSRTLGSHAGTIFVVAGNRDGTLLATAGEDGAARLWLGGFDGGGDSLRLAHEPGTEVWGVAFSPDGSVLATAGEDGTTRIWDVEACGRGRCDRVRELLKIEAHTEGVNSAAFRGARLATAGEDFVPKIWDLESGAERFALEGHGERVFNIVYSPDGELLATASVDQTAKIWDAATGGLRHTLEHGDRVYVAEFSPDGRRVATASADHTARVWNVGSGSVERWFRGHSDAVRSVAFSADGQRLATASADGTAKIWAVESGRELLWLRGHKGPVWGVLFSPDGRRLATASADGALRIWSLPASHGAEITDLDADPVRGRLATAGSDGVIKLWEWRGGRLEERAQVRHLAPGQDVPAERRGAFSVAVEPRGERLATGGPLGEVKLWRIGDDRPPAVLRGHQGPVNGLAFSPDGRFLATASSDKTVRLWTLDGSSELVEFGPFKMQVFDVAFSPEGRRLAMVGYEKKIRIWGVEEGKLEELAVEGLEYRTFAVAFSPDGQRLATGGGDKTARLWDLATGEVLRAFRGHTAAVYAVAFNQEGSLLATASADGTPKVWEVATGEERTALAVHSGPVTGVAFIDEDRQLATGSWDAKVLVFPFEVEKLREVADERVPRSLTPEECERYPIADGCRG